MNHSGKLILVVGISGSGKGALMRAARGHFADAVFPVSCTTRERRPGEIPGVNYYFLTDAEFDARIDAGDFLEWEPYGGHRYGTLKSEIVPALASGKIVLHEVEIHGARHFRELVPKESVLVIYILAGSWESLKRRILSRAPMTDEELEKRRLRFEEELRFKQEADVVIDNPDGELEHAQGEFIAAIEMIARS